MKTLGVIPVAALLALAGCGDNDQGRAGRTGDATTEAKRAGSAAMGGKHEAAATATATSGDAAAMATRARTRIVLGRSEFGTMLFGPKRQAIYIFERDRPDQTVCYGACAEAWPPVFTDGEPKAGKGVKRSLLGTIERRGGRRQVTYDGRPLYYYAHEGPGEVRCHNVNLNGGLWWVVGPDGNRRA